MYSDYKLDVISFDEYRDMKEDFEKQYITRNQQLASLEKHISELKSSNGLDSDVIKHYKQYYGSIEKLDRKLITSLIDKIFIDSDRNLKIVFKFQDEIIDD